MRYEISRKLAYCGMKAKESAVRLLAKGMNKEPGVDGILVAVGLCIIALLLCVLMRKHLADFMDKIMGMLSTEAENILKGVTK